MEAEAGRGEELKCVIRCRWAEGAEALHRRSLLGAGPNPAPTAAGSPGTSAGAGYRAGMGRRSQAAFGLVFGGLALVLAAACVAIVALAGDGWRIAPGLIPVAAYAWLVRPARVDRHGIIGLALATVVLLVFVAAWAVGADGWVGALAAAVGVVVADRTLWLVGRLVRGAYR